MHQERSLFSDPGNVVQPDGLIASWEMGVCNREEVVQKAQIGVGKLEWLVIAGRWLWKNMHR